MSSLPADYLERVYAGVLGKLIGVYLGRPIEGWTHQQIMEELGHIEYYVHEKLDKPLVVTDDDISGTFVFVRAMEEHGATKDISSEAIGKTWLNNVVERRSVFWWGGRGISTEHTAFLNLKNGIPAPRSGSIQTNGKTVAEQIGAQIFIDAWPMVVPGQPEMAAKLAEAAGSVSHDGESVYAAKLWAAMEAEAFKSNDIDHLLDTGLQLIPGDSSIAKLISDVRAWVKEDRDWLKTRQRIEDVYGYDKYCGNCHVMPNHGIMIMAILYAGNNFHEAMHIINTCGWDTDCNSGNVGCLVALMHGMPAFEGGPDWRSPLADRALISSADGGYSINNAARIALDVANLGYRCAGENPPPAPKDGAQFHFTLPGSVQGFQAAASGSVQVNLAQGVDEKGRAGLRITVSGLEATEKPVEILTETFKPPNVPKMGPIYPLMASPLVYPGQKVTAVVHGGQNLSSEVVAQLLLKYYGTNDDLVTVTGPAATLAAGATQSLEWVIPDELDSQPIYQIGLGITTTEKPASGTVWLDRLSWSGTPQTTFQRPPGKRRVTSKWHEAWVDSTDDFHKWMNSSFVVGKNQGRGILAIGTRDWVDYQLEVPKFQINIGRAGVAVRVRGLNRFNALLFEDMKKISLVRVADGATEVLASTGFDWQVDAIYSIKVVVSGSKIAATVDGTTLEAVDGQYQSGGVGLVVIDGSTSVDAFKIGPVSA
ncbi:ADP-ribosylglycohydrolase [Thozetella sp. PMI_491]|nr:ADP-ribosylglycohydrolase [Thozetella sp. PMI_491]